MRTPADLDLARRLLALEQGIEAVLDELRPDAVAVERVFSQHNVRTVMGTAQAGAIAIAAAARRGIPVALHTPSEVKAAVTGHGRADKDQVGAMVARLLGLAEAPKPADAADALALAICHLWRGDSSARLAAAAAAAPAAADPAHRAGRRPARARSPRGGRRVSVIAYVRGPVAAVGPGSAVIEVGGVGLELQCAPATIAELRARPDRHPRCVARGARGLADAVRLRRRRRARRSSRPSRPSPASGPRLAQSLLAVHRPDSLRRAVADDDVAALMRVPGVGPQGRPAPRARAQGPPRRPDRHRPRAAPRPRATTGRCGRARCTPRSSGLGWSTREADAAVGAVAEEVAPDADVATVLRAALRSLDRA